LVDAIDDKAATMALVAGVVGSFEEDIVPRDTDKINKLAETLSLVRRVRLASMDEDQVGAFMSIPNYITVEDLACSLAVTLADKQTNHTYDSAALVSEVLKEYVGIVNEFLVSSSVRLPFDKNNASTAVCPVAIKRAAATAKRAKSTEAVDTFLSSLGASAQSLSSLVGGFELRKPMIARFIADLGTLGGFCLDYEDAIAAKAGKATSVEQAIKSTYLENSRGLTVPSIYKHRMPRILGI
jgi:hypothetical protein